MGALAQVVTMAMAKGVVAKRTTGYLSPRMCDGLFLECGNPKNTLTFDIH
jgi:hypothetical protein